MERIQLSVEVAAIADDVVAELKAAGHEVFQGRSSWRVVTTVPTAGEGSVRAQAHDAARRIIREFGLQTLTDPPALSLRDPDTLIDTQGTNLVLDEVRRAYDPDPTPRPKRKWYQKQMELGLGERKDP